jgi:putative RecB family exonuclease
VNTTLECDSVTANRFELDHISPSSLKEYLGCSLRYYFSRVLRLHQPVSVALHLGKSVHSGIEFLNHALWREQAVSEEELISFFEESFRFLEENEGPVQFSDEKARTDSVECGKRVLLAFMRSEVYRNSGKPKGVETSLSMPVKGRSGIALTGFVDRVDASNRAVDYKSVASTPQIETELWLHEMQLVAYQELIESATDEVSPGAELVFLVKTKTPKVITASMPPATKVQRQRFWSLVDRAIDGIQTERFHPSPGMHCSWCSFRNQCAKWNGGRS